MKKTKRVDFTFYTVALEALKYKSKSEFAKIDKSAYNFASRNNILEQICAHMDHDYWKWTDEELQKEALKYNTKKSFLEGNAGAYSSAVSRGLLKNITQHMTILWDKKWDVESLKKEALKYDNKNDFFKNSGGAYVAASKLNILHDISIHMNSRMRDDWNELEIQEEALKYNHRKDFSKGSSGAYHAARRLKIIDKVCEHMVFLTNTMQRALYVFEHSDKSAYIGLTWNYKERYNAHMLSNLTLIEKKELDQRFIALNIWYSPKQAAVEEINLIEKYASTGWTILNKVKGGALGGNRLRWTLEKIIEEAKKYSTKKEFMSNALGAYKCSLKSGLHEEICVHMVAYKRLKNESR